MFEFKNCLQIQNNEFSREEIKTAKKKTSKNDCHPEKLRECVLKQL